MNARRKVSLSILSIALVFVLAASAYAEVLSFPRKQQEHNQWCWNASSQAVLEYFGVVASQTDIAAWAVEGFNVPNFLSGSSARIGNPGPGIDDWRRDVNMPSRKGMNMVLDHYGNIKTTFYGRALTKDELKTEIEGSRPVPYAWIWTTGGGHALVIHGFNNDTSMVSITDPWEDNGQTTSAYDWVVSNADHNWRQSLTLSVSLDIVFLIDSTGSMWDDIAAVKESSNSILDTVTERFKDARIAVVDYRDYPDGVHAETWEYLTNDRCAFTTDVAVARDAINSIAIGNGLDWDEGVLSAVAHSIIADTLGGWRSGNVNRTILIMGDAPGHDPEDWPPYYTMSDVIALALAGGTTSNGETGAAGPVTIFGVAIGGSSGNDYAELAGATGGTVVNAANANEVVDAMTDAIEAASELKNRPSGNVLNRRPQFEWQGTGSFMESPVKNYLLEIQRKTGDAWRKYQSATIKPGVMTWLPKKDFPIADYRWRANWKPMKGKTVLSDLWTEFSRLAVLPDAITLVSPSGAVAAAKGGAVTYKWLPDSQATSYALRISRNGQPWKTIKVRAPKPTGAAGADAASLPPQVPPKELGAAAEVTYTLKGHSAVDKTGAVIQYSWSVQGLNADRPKPLEDAWSNEYWFSIIAP